MPLDLLWRVPHHLWRVLPVRPEAETPRPSLVLCLHCSDAGSCIAPVLCGFLSTDRGRTFVVRSVSYMIRPIILLGRIMAPPMVGMVAISPCRCHPKRVAGSKAYASAAMTRRLLSC